MDICQSFSSIQYNILQFLFASNVKIYIRRNDKYIKSFSNDFHDFQALEYDEWALSSLRKTKYNIKAKKSVSLKTMRSDLAYTLLQEKKK